VSGWAGAGNVGDELLTRSMVHELRALDAVPVIASRDPRATAALHGVESVPWGPKGRSSLGAVDGVCLGPGGILQDSSSLWSLPAHLAAPSLARRRGLPVAAIGVGAEPLRRRSSAWLLRRTLRGSTVVTRDPESSACLAAAGISATTGADVVFGLEFVDAPPANEIVVSVGGSVRSGLVSPASRRIESAPTEEIASAVDRLAAALDATVVLTRFRGERDGVAAREIAELMAAPTEILGPDVDEHVRRVSGARLVISSRYHPLVLAARSGVGAIAVSSQAKVQSLVAQLGSDQVRRVESWGDVATTALPEGGPGAVPGGLAAARHALSVLVAEAGAFRDQQRGG
jgi:polysaccharide pyruvyl transferase CsaB